MTDTKPKLLKLSEAEAIARDATKAALAAHPKKAWFDDPNLTLGTFFPDDDHYEFSLYLAGERPADGVVLTTAVVDRRTGKVKVTIKPEAIEEATT